MALKTAAQIRREFEKRGASISQWAVANGFNPNQVFNVLAGRNRGCRGKSHDIAVMLGMKNGAVGDPPDYPSF